MMTWVLAPRRDGNYTSQVKPTIIHVNQAPEWTEDHWDAKACKHACGVLWLTHACTIIVHVDIDQAPGWTKDHEYAEACKHACGVIIIIHV